MKRSPLFLAIALALGLLFAAAPFCSARLSLSDARRAWLRRDRDPAALDADAGVSVAGGGGTTKDGLSVASTKGGSSSSSSSSGGKVGGANYDGCLPPISLILDRTGTMTRPKTEQMLDEIGKFLTMVNIKEFDYVETPFRNRSKLTEDTDGFFKKMAKPEVQHATSMAAVRTDILSRAAPKRKVTKGGRAPMSGDGDGFTDLLTPLTVSASGASKKGPKLVIMITDELNNVYAGFPNGNDFCSAWKKQVTDIEKAGGIFTLLFIETPGAAHPYSKDVKYWTNSYAKGSSDTGDVDSFRKCYETILSQPYVVKGASLSDCLQRQLANITMSVFFTSDSTSLNAADKQLVDQKVKCCSGNVRISCHTSKCGSEAHNLNLRKSRCEEVKSLHSQKITDVAFDKSVFRCPQDGPGNGCSEENTQCAQVNRRVDISCTMLSTRPSK